MLTVIGSGVLCLLLLIKRLYFWKGKAPRNLQSGFILVSHRGITGEARDNTLNAISAVGESPCEFVEIDVRLTAEGEVVVFHDPVIYDDRGRPCKISKLSFQQLQSISATFKDGSFRVPSLEEALRVLPENVGLILELKTSSLFNFRLERNVIRILKNHQGKQTIILSSFNPFSLMRIKLFSRSALRAFVWKDGSVPVVFNGSLWIRLIHPDFLHPEYRNVAPFVMRLARKHRLPVHVWTLNDRALVEKFLSLGVQGIFTDNPNILDSEQIRALLQ